MTRKHCAKYPAMMVMTITDTVRDYLERPALAHHTHMHQFEFEECSEWIPCDGKITTVKY